MMHGRTALLALSACSVALTTAAVASHTEAAPVPLARPSTEGGKKIVAVTACPTGVAHTFMAAEALIRAGQGLGHSLRVETRG